MTDEMHKVAVEQYGKLEYPVTHEELYCAGFEAGARFVYDRLCEEQLKEAERTLHRVLNAFGSWKPEVKKG